MFKPNHNIFINNKILMKLSIFVFAAFSFCFCTNPQKAIKTQTESTKNIITGAEQTEKYLPYIKGKRVAILANQTSMEM